MKNERRNTTQPSDWWAAFEAEADRRGDRIGRDSSADLQVVDLHKQFVEGDPVFKAAKVDTDRQVNLQVALQVDDAVLRDIKRNLIVELDLVLQKRLQLVEIEISRAAEFEVEADE